jgi:hypothetical protein
MKINARRDRRVLEIEGAASWSELSLGPLDRQVAGRSSPLAWWPK